MRPLWAVSGVENTCFLVYPGNDLVSIRFNMVPMSCGRQLLIMYPIVMSASSPQAWIPPAPPSNLEMVVGGLPEQNNA